MQERVYKTPVRYTSDLKQRLIDSWTSISQNVIDEAVGEWRKWFMCMREGEMTSL